jgi:hypothetical protein
VATITRRAKLDVPADAAWRFVDRYTRCEVHMFPSLAASERQEGEYRVVTRQNGAEVWERMVGVDHDTMRAAYIIPGIPGVEHHAASMQIIDDGDGRSTVVWITDVLPDSMADALAPTFDTAFADMVAALNGCTDG